VVEIRLRSQRAYVASHPELVWQILSDDVTFDKGGPLIDQLRDVLGDGLGTCDRQSHRRQRPLVQPAFQRAAGL
jgi:pentalenene oxygenase